MFSFTETTVQLEQWAAADSESDAEEDEKYDLASLPIAIADQTNLNIILRLSAKLMRFLRSLVCWLNSEIVAICTNIYTTSMCYKVQNFKIRRN